MELSLKIPINPFNIAKIFLFLWLISLFFPIHYTFLNRTSLATGSFSDFTSISLYLSDILLFVTWIFILPRGKSFYHVVKPLKYLIFWVFLAFLANLGSNWPQNLFFLAKFIELVVAYGTISIIFKETSVKTAFLSLFVALATIQSLLALNQFYLQHPIGLYKLGEQQIYSFNQGIAKIVVSGITYIRGYGTFPHPNLLSAYLLGGIFICLYLFSFTNKLIYKAIFGACLIVNVLGITVTFSRAAFFSLAVGLVIYFGYVLLKKKWHSEYTGKIIILLIAAILSLVLFHKFLLVRDSISFSDQAVVERGYYNNVGLTMIKEHPLFGVGLGESVLHMQQYTSFKLWPWQYQPIHNYFLLAAAELGIPGALILIWIFWSHIKSMGRDLSDPFHLSVFSILFCFAILMFFDHYFYTLQQTQMLLWLVLALAASEIPTKTY